MADQKRAILQFKKTASPQDKAKLIDELKSKGAQVTNDDHINSQILPFISFSIPEEHFDSLRQQSLSGEHDVVEHVEADSEMRIQS
ncbi:MAG: hypothetical protein TREMPRED_005480 [Tremellales sp. Tagirdzhanova-0007]|nr:MAG: hypothetical protein TREMPRED_005480 [Tremellales sp. Tagirdzhanova-0007]